MGKNRRCPIEKHVFKLINKKDCYGLDRITSEIKRGTKAF